MAGTVNKVILIGHLGDEIKMHYFEGGNAIGRFPIATNESYTNKQTGEKVTTTDWHNIVVKNKLAEICEKYLTKGDKVYCEGKLKNKQWEQEGVKRYATEVHVTEMTFLSTKKSLEKPATQMSPENQTTTPATKKTVSPEINDDLPF
ncbi:MAG: single-stranded DNA-binding protein [Polaribacter sp.]|jgi:single-strand DNA-binding protein|nr:single-stranded DNA-binding protein [Polaribacter sp.]MBT4779275.1 single-stranded DNA-binding protein [Polaribacter sp.]MBT5645532.1 single-stranded DNA-binding protein [Polaribacter sp.]MBT7705797.1 single-stranded DNA-binding protein [Polaribacter sp.]MDA9092785.1 single-stranded DNA-binding protein [Polaribacter sp.]MDA9235165.1 single-stranded DNA-binding protein [Polaribacter sp.]